MLPNSNCSIAANISAANHYNYDDVTIAELDKPKEDKGEEENPE
jgi:hypothetical protein